MDGVVDGVGWVVLPCVDEEAVEAAECGEEKCGWKQGGAEGGLAGDRRDEGGGGEADAYGELFGVAVGVLRGVDENEVSEDQAAEDEVEVDGFGWDAWEGDREGQGGEEDSDEEGCAVAVVEV